MTEIPDWIEERIAFDNTREVQDRHIIEVFLESEEPYLSSRYVASKIGLTKQGTQPRLEELEDIDVLDGDSVAGGRIFWLKDDRSDYPIPPDVEVEPIQQETTVKELVNQLPVQYALLGVGVIILGALFMMAFTLLLAYEVGIPIISTTDLLVGGVLLTFIGFALLLVAVAVGSWNRIF